MFEDDLISMYDRDKKIPMWLGGILLALVLILVSNRGSGGLTNPVLIGRFVPRPTNLGAPTAQTFQLPQVHLPSLPPAVQDSLTKLRDRFAGGEGIPALTPVASGPRVKVEVGGVRRVGDQVQLKGSLVNISNATLTIPPGAFSFRDSGGISYSTAGSVAVTLAAGQTSALELGVPLPDGRGLTLILNVPPDPPLEQVLIVEAKAS